jgi:hypothetical protein
MRGCTARLSSATTLANASSRLAIGCHGVAMRDLLRVEVLFILCVLLAALIWGPL